MTTNDARVAVLETNFKNMTEKINLVDKKVDTIILKLEEMDNKYARKASVDKLRVIVWSIIGFVFTALGTVVLSLVFTK